LIAFAKADQAALRPTESELAKLPISAQQAEPPKRKRGPKGPNPLSVKKKKSAVPLPVQQESKKSMPIGSKRKRGDERDGVEASAESAGVSQAPGSGHKRKRRRKMKTNPPPATMGYDP